MGRLIDEDEVIKALDARILDPHDKDRAISAVGYIPTAHPELDEWCTDCKEYDAERHCCPRFNRVIRETLADMKKERGK